MRTKKLANHLAFFLFFSGLLVVCISCNPSSNRDETENSIIANDTPHLQTLEMKRPGNIIPKDSAAKMVKAYRNAGGGPFSTQIVLHHPDAVKFYMDSIFYKYTPAIVLPQNHIWRVAFSPMYYLRQPGGPKLSFCLVPCIVDTSSSRVYEFFNQMDSTSDYYTKYYLPLYNSIGPLKITSTMTNTSSRGFIFNEGQLWP